MAIVSTGITIAVTGATTFLAEIIDVTLPSLTRESLDTSHQGTVTYKTFTPSKLIDNGELKVDIWFDPDQTVPISAVPNTVLITFPDTGATTWSFTGFLTNYEPTGSLDKLMTASCTFKVSGAITMTP